MCICSWMATSTVNSQTASPKRIDGSRTASLTASPNRARKRARATQWPLVLVYEHEDCAEHDTGGHQEGADRLSSIRRALGRVKGVEFTSDFDPAGEAALERVHSRGYLDVLNELDTQFALGNRGPEPLSPHIAKKLFPDSKTCGMTLVSRGTLRAARRAAGAVIASIDGVVKAAASWTVDDGAPIGGAPHAAFCLVRPPGHHSMVDGFDPAAGGCGFCVINSVAVGAAHALYSLGMRVAIVDFDVHHGNGTEAITGLLVRGLYWVARLAPPLHHYEAEPFAPPLVALPKCAHSIRSGAAMQSRTRRSTPVRGSAGHAFGGGRDSCSGNKSLPVL